MTAGPSIETIASLLGYNDPANFTRAFKRWTGFTPIQYRTMHLRDNALPRDERIDLGSEG